MLFKIRNINSLFRHFCRGQVVTWSQLSDSEVVALVNSVSGSLNNPQPPQSWVKVKVSRRQMTKMKNGYADYKDIKKVPAEDKVIR